MLIRHSAVEHRWVYTGRESWGFVCKSETVEKIGEVDEMGERELVLVVSGQCQVRQGVRHDTWMTIASRTQRCAILSLPALEPRVFA